MALAAGSRLGPYEIVAPLGAGGMGQVYRASDTRLRRDVAIKILPTSVAGDATRLRRLEQEARATAALSHPNILGEAQRLFTIDRFVDGNMKFDVMPDGQTFVAIVEGERDRTPLMVSVTRSGS